MGLIISDDLVERVLEQWDAVLSEVSELSEFIDVNKSRLKTKDQTKK
jgi:hypothetical protein